MNNCDGKCLIFFLHFCAIVFSHMELVGSLKEEDRKISTDNSIPMAAAAAAAAATEKASVTRTKLFSNDRRILNSRMPSVDHRLQGNQPEDSTAYDNLRKYRDIGNARFIQTKFWNTSVQYVIPLFSFSFPATQAQGSNIEMVHQAMYALFVLFIISCMFAWPVVITDPLNAIQAAMTTPAPGGRGRGRNGREFFDGGISMETVMESTAGKVHWLMDSRLANEIGLDKDQCMAKTICQAHESPQRPGLVATVFRTFFPQQTTEKKEKENERDELNKFSQNEGNSTTAKAEECAKNYKCFFDLLDLTHYFLDWWSLSSNNNTVHEPY